MHAHAEPSTPAPTATSTTLATVTPLPNPHRRRPTAATVTHAGPASNDVFAWVLQLLDLGWVSDLLDPGQCHGTVRAALHPSITWTDLTTAAQTDHGIDIADPTDTNPDNLDAALASAFATLSQIGARPRLDVDVTLRPDHVTFALRGLCADPVMTSAAADTITAALNSHHTAWHLHATDHGALQWQLANYYPNELL